MLLVFESFSILVISQIKSILIGVGIQKGGGGGWGAKCMQGKLTIYRHKSSVVDAFSM